MTHQADDVMHDATFTVPVRIDSVDRLANLRAVVGYLRRVFPSRILVGSEEPHGLQTILPAGVEVVPIEGGLDLPFHHTRMNNDLARLVDTDVVINIEADILIPAAQLRRAVGLAVSAAADLVLPYDHAVDVNREERTSFAAASVEATADAGRKRWNWAVIGGCMVWNRRSLFDFGMDNEYFVSWGLEDDERLVRLAALGGTIERVSGPLFHLQHERGGDSSDRTRYFVHNQLHLHRTKATAASELRRQVDSWPWRTRTTSQPAQQVASDDLTVVIPVRIDSDDRLHNLHAIVRALRNFTTATILIGVGQPATIGDKWPPGVQIIELDDGDGPFHRTRRINQLIDHARTPFVAVHDADVIVSAAQWDATLDLLRAGADMVFPFDGTMRDHPFAHHVWLERGWTASMPESPLDVLHPDSVGGVVAWRMDSYRAIGMENEHFVSWGFEDDERLARARALGLTIARVPGDLAHLNHQRGADSTQDNPHFAANEAELARIRSLSRDQLAAEVAGWPWRTRSDASPAVRTDRVSSG